MRRSPSGLRPRHGRRRAIVAVAAQGQQHSRAGLAEQCGFGGPRALCQEHQAAAASETSASAPTEASQSQKPGPSLNWGPPTKPATFQRANRARPQPHSLTKPGAATHPVEHSDAIEDVSTHSGRAAIRRELAEYRALADEMRALIKAEVASTAESELREGHPQEKKQVRTEQAS